MLLSVTGVSEQQWVLREAVEDSILGYLFEKKIVRELEVFLVPYLVAVAVEGIGVGRIGVEVGYLPKMVVCNSEDFLPQETAELLAEQEWAVGHNSAKAACN